LGIGCWLFELLLLAQQGLRLAPSVGLQQAGDTEKMDLGFKCCSAEISMSSQHSRSGFSQHAGGA